MIDTGFCVSNFMYLLRAFSKNDLFVEYVKEVVKFVSETAAEQEWGKQTKCVNR